MATKPIKKQEYNSKEERLAALRAKGRALNTKMGFEIVKVASDLAPIRRAPFGIPELDEMLGGGIPHGSFTTIWGGPGSGKTSSAFELTAQSQRDGKIVLWIPLEPFDAVRAKQFGVNLEELQLAQAPQAEQVLDIIVDYTRDKLVDVIVLDSIHSLAPKGMQENSKGEKSLSEETMAILARKLSEFFKIATDPVKRSETAVLLIGQTRMKVGFITIEALTGGNALHHGCRLIIRQRRGASDEAPFITRKNEKTDKNEKVIIGFPTVYKLDKVQVSGCKTEGTVLTLPYYYETGFKLPKEVQDENADIEAQTSEKKPLHLIQMEGSDEQQVRPGSMTEETPKKKARKKKA